MQRQFPHQQARPVKWNMAGKQHRTAALHIGLEELLHQQTASIIQRIKWLIQHPKAGVFLQHQSRQGDSAALTLRQHPDGQLAAVKNPHVAQSGFD